MTTGHEGSWKTTRSIGRECKAGDRLSRPVLTAKTLDHPDSHSTLPHRTVDGPSHAVRPLLRPGESSPGSTFATR